MWFVEFSLISRYRNCGPVAGPFFVLIFTICHILLQFFEWLYPRHLIDIAPDYNKENRLC